jgi:transcriptional regulator of acetoin/glycerol metabolism
MQPIDYPVDLDALARGWDTFMRTGRLEPEQQTALDPAVLQSWRRCAIRLDPRANPRPAKSGDRALASVIKAQAQLTALALPVAEDIHQFIEGSGCAVLLADGTACVHTLVGDTSCVVELSEAGLGEGAYWSEGQLGTNGLSVALAEAMPAQVVGPEHYFRAYHHLVSTAAPVHDVRGRIVGIIGVVGPVETATAHTLALTMSAARAISNQLHADWYLAEANWHLSEVNTILGAVSEGVIAWDETGRIHHVNAQAGQILGLNPASILGRPLLDVLTLPPLFMEAVQTNMELRDVETTLTVDGRPVDCLASLRTVHEGAPRPVGYIAMLRPMQQVRRLVHQQIGARAALTLDDLASQSAKMRQILRQARIAARGTAPVLISGEGGVGKNHLARAIHNEGRRADQPFIAIDCRAIPHELMTSEFLGHEKDANTDGRPSKFELAIGGTLLLDQIESLSLELQTALLRVLETGHVMRLGGTHPIPVDIRIMAATTANMEQLVVEGSFVPHLYYRFGVFNIFIPPLRERVEDIPLLAERFLARISQRDDRPFWIDEEALSVLRRYPWPGNVREMESVLERAINHSRDGFVRVVDLPDSIRVGRVVTKDSPQAQPILSIADVEREAIIRAGWACQGRVTEMAQQLGIGRTTLWRKMKRLSLSPEYFKQ